ncbi:Bax inhibitor-1/YccA family protein [Occallatibacter riparius]|uniref:Bax inhibitor-1/YccA family protein n=1 Tax=Occallatibacter riparius TaxID=1002689 RepID=A0A9J7BU91_9BACT|nr:Bax inhibitor-1/YccA family protein [Occallatibacter riparius]UWZ84494.1 Bax inhibitor-1/YccA family protein [Occallatibacter riparius]
MPLLKTSNPALGENTFRNAGGGYGGGLIDATARMTLSGTVNKTGLLLILAFASGAWTWFKYLSAGNPGAVGGLMMLGVFGGFICAMVTIFKKEWAPVTAPLYALMEGLFLGGISAMFDQRYPGIAIQAVGLTFGTLLALLLAYSARIIKVTQKFALGIVAATGGIALFYFAQMILGFFHIQFLSSVNGSGTIGILFSLFVVAIAALNLVLDFDFIERGVNYGAPKYMEWYGAFGIMVTLVWLYLEILRLLAKTRSRD